MKNLNLLPDYSLADLFSDINHGNINEFSYNGNLFSVKRYGNTWEVINPLTGHTAKQNGYINCMLDLQGLGACLIEYKRNLIFDREGNIKN